MQKGMMVVHFEVGMLFFLGVMISGLYIHLWLAQHFLESWTC